MVIQELLGEHRLTPAQRRIAAYLLANAADAAYLTSSELAERAEVSQPSVTRFVALLGFDGYPQFRRHLRTAEPAQVPSGTNKFQIALDADARALAALRAGLVDPTPLVTLGRRLVESNPLVVMGFRVSGPIAALFGYLAAKIHPDVRVLDDGGSVLGDRLRQAHAQGAAAALVFALPRYPSETRAALLAARELGLHAVLLTDSPVSPLTPDADEVLTAGVAGELVFDSHAAVMSLSAMLLEAMADAAGAEARHRLERFEEYAAAQEIFLAD